MRIFENPILRSSVTLAWGGTYRVALLSLAAVATFAGCLYLFGWRDVGGPSERVWKDLYRVVLTLQGFAAVGAILASARRVTLHRKDGTLDANRLTPMSPQRLAEGYWLGPMVGPLAVILTGTAFAMFLVLVTPRASVDALAVSQAVVLSTTLLFGLCATWLALEAESRHVLVLVTLGAPALIAGVGALGTSFIGSFVLGLPGLTPLRTTGLVEPTWLWSTRMSPVALTFATQAVVGLVAWRAVVRKMARPEERGLSTGMALLLFATMSLLQHGLIAMDLAEPLHWTSTVRSATFGGLLVGLGLALCVATAAGLDSRRARRLVLRTGTTRAGLAVRSGVGVAAITGALATGLFAVHPVETGGWFALAAVGTASTAVAVVALIEFASLRATRSAALVAGLVVLAWLFLPLLSTIAFDDDIIEATLGVSPLLALQAAFDLPEGSPWVIVGNLGAAVFAAGALVAWWRELCAFETAARFTAR
ncbi:MAG: hypothetical protein H6700_01030 [Myxococcales bacterium]|nr:hypothetical protein [Myxococcales bacterium]MCB9530331.1 hypothetical protein [Myxococcales bacterium]